MSARVAFDSAEGCDRDNSCTQDGVNERNSAITRAHMSLGFAGAGTVLIGVAAVWALTGDSAPATSGSYVVPLLGSAETPFALGVGGVAEIF